MKNTSALLAVVCLTVGLFFGVMVAQTPVPPTPTQVNSVFGLTMDRFDYVITDVSQNGFSTTAPLRGSVILVIRNGLVMTMNADYKQVVGANARVSVNFISPLVLGDKVSIIYWR